MNPDESEDVLTDTQLYDLSKELPVTHSFDHIVGNELRCSLHHTCAVIHIKPTEVLEKGDDGQLVLVDKAPRM
jgi:hypothetical protein